jgi:hypothetical protein
MAVVVVLASWGSGSIIPARMAVAIPSAVPAVPIAPAEEHESHSSTSVVTLTSGSVKYRGRLADSTNHRRVKALTRQSVVLPRRFELSLCSHSDGHRLANDLMAPMTV